MWEWTCLDENVLVKSRKKLTFFFILEKGNQKENQIMGKKFLLNNGFT